MPWRRCVWWFLAHIPGLAEVVGSCTRMNAELVKLHLSVQYHFGLEAVARRHTIFHYHVEAWHV